MTNTNYHLQANSGFVAGTLVHTDKGLIAIQDIKVGDMVLSSPEEGGGSIREYKPVVHLFKNNSAKIYELIYRYYISETAEHADEIGGIVQEHIYLTKEHPIVNPKLNCHVP